MNVININNVSCAREHDITHAQDLLSDIRVRDMSFVCLRFYVPFENLSLLWRLACSILVKEDIFLSGVVAAAMKKKTRYVTITGEGLQILTYTRHCWPLSSEGSLSCHTYCDTGQ